MNTSALDAFARRTRTRLMEAVSGKLAYVLSADTADLRAAAGQVASLREAARRDRPGLVERAAYIWFNRLTALRFLDARGWHPFAVRVVCPSGPGQTQPELLQRFREGALPPELAAFANTARLNALLDGHLPPAFPGADPQAEVYRALVLAACRYYHARMPFLFEDIDDETELLLPDDLLTTQSVVEGFRTGIADDDCDEVEVLGWLYQFYIAEKKDQVMARKAAVPSADIPAVTQLFTPHWIVRYLVENSLGRLWLLNRPGSKLRERMPYYIEDAPAPNPQPPAPFPHLDRPEDIRLLDPACGSGHMLTYAFDLLYAIYEEEGYPAADIPGLILSHNLHGLEICPRATQLAQFALVCKARERNRNAFRQPIGPRVMCLQNVVIGDGEQAAWAKAMKLEGMIAGPVLEQLRQFKENTETFGALIQPVMDAAAIVGMKKLIGDEAPPGDLFLQDTHRKVRLVLDQAEMLAQRYQVVVANPPYLGSGQNSVVKEFARLAYPKSKADLYSMFLERGFAQATVAAYVAMVTMESWMFLTSFEALRGSILDSRTILRCVHMPYLGKGGTSMGINFGTVAMVFSARHIAGFPAHFSCVRYFETNEKGEPLEFPVRNERLRTVCADAFGVVPGKTIAYWASDSIRQTFLKAKALGLSATAQIGMATGNNSQRVRSWHEVSSARIGWDRTSRHAANESKKRWFPYSKGGEFRKWSGNREAVVDWENDGQSLRSTLVPGGTRIWAHNFNLDRIFKPGICWTVVTSGSQSFRLFSEGYLFDAASGIIQMNFSDQQGLAELLGFLNSKVSTVILRILNPTINLHPGYLQALPYPPPTPFSTNSSPWSGAISLSSSDWDNFETSWDFQDSPLLRSTPAGDNLESIWNDWADGLSANIVHMRELETQNNRLWIEAYGLQDELSPEVPEEEITLARPDRRKDMAAFLSYAVGCMIGRYALDKPGLILADAGDTLEHYLVKVGKPRERWTFAPDEDGIIPVLDGEWFGDDIVARTREFLRVTFGEATLEENIRFIEDSLGKDLQSYFAAQFYKDHLQTYKKRPIYWLFQSPRKSFQCLVYLHRYTRDTVNRVLNRYLREYLAKMRHALQGHENTLASVAASARDKTRARKEADALRRAIRECEDWERDTLLPLAQRRIDLDLDDGVKVNYLKLGDALAPIPGLAAPEDA